MFAKVIGFSSLNAVFGRGVYYVAADIESHRQLNDLQRWFLGAGVHGVYSLHGIARITSERWSHHRGARRRYAFVEVIISTPKNAGMELGEDRFLAARVVNDFECIAAMAGSHWHKDGRVDIHVFLLNETVSGFALGTNTVLPSTSRVFRHVEVLARQFSDAAHDELNRKRERSGRPRIPTMIERRAELSRRRAEEHERLVDEWAKRSAMCARLLGRSIVQAQSEISVTANDGAGASPVEVLPQGGRREAISAPHHRSADPAATPSPGTLAEWFLLTALLHRWMQLLADAVDEEQMERELKEAARWFESPTRMLLRPEIEAALAVACERCTEDAIEAREALDLSRELFRERSRDVERNHDLD